MSDQECDCQGETMTAEEIARRLDEAFPDKS